MTGWRKKVIDSYSSDIIFGRFKGLSDRFLAERRFFQMHMNQKGLVLDIGCGTGREAFMLARDGHKIVAFDVTFRLIQESKRNFQTLNIPLLCASAEYLPFKANIFKYVVMTNGIIQYIYSRRIRQSSLRDAHRVLQKDGKVIINIVNDRLLRTTMGVVGPLWLATLLFIIFFTVIQCVNFLVDLLRSLRIYLCGSKYDWLEPGDVGWFGSASYFHTYKPSELLVDLAKAGFNNIEKQPLSRLTQTQGGELKKLFTDYLEKEWFFAATKS